MTESVTKTKVPPTHRWDYPEKPAWAVCDACYDAGYILVSPNVQLGHPLYGYEERRVCPALCPKGLSYAEERWKLLIPPGYQGFSFETWSDQLAAEEKNGKWLGFVACVRWSQAADFYTWSHDLLKEAALPYKNRANFYKNSLVLTGRVGTGKTGLMVAAARRLLVRGTHFVYIRLDDLIESVQATYRKDSGQPTDAALAPYKGVRVLLLDEVTENTSRDRIEILEGIIRWRYMSRRPFVITTNLSQSLFREAWGERIADVVDAQAHWVEVLGKNLRPIDRPLGGA